MGKRKTVLSYTTINNEDIELVVKNIRVNLPWSVASGYS